MSDIARIEEPEIDDRIERLVWKGLGRKSARQIAEEAGITPETVLRVKKQLLDGVDILSIDQAQQKLIVDLQDIAQRAQDDYDSAPWDFKSGLMNSATSAMKAVLAELNRARAKNDSAIQELNQLRIRELYTLVNRTVVRSVSEISERYDLPNDDLMEVFNRALLEEAAAQDASI